MRPSGWKTETVEACLEALSLRSTAKLQTKDYQTTGAYPIIDQGQAFIAGWTDKITGLISSPLPLIVFGDHTRAFKFVDFPFVRGADGTQLLRPRGDIDPLFFYYACRAIDLPSRGYNRHFTLLREAELELAPLDEQTAIAAVLRRIEDGLAIQDQQLQTCAELKKVAMRELFTRGLGGEVQKESQIGLIPESWFISSLGELTTLERGRFLHRPRNEPRFYGGNTPFIQTGDVVRSGGRIREFTQTLNDDGVAISRVFPTGTILITIAANIGFTGILKFDGACPDSLIAITPTDRLNNEFLEYWLQTQQSEMDRLAPKGTQKNINIQFLNPWPVAVPTLEEQHEIVAVLNAIDRKIDLHRNKRQTFDKLFNTLLHKLLTGEISVGDLDLSALASMHVAEAAQ
jgi:type I restriction enzyme S subunit